MYYNPDNILFSQQLLVPNSILSLITTVLLQSVNTFFQQLGIAFYLVNTHA